MTERIRTRDRHTKAERLRDDKPDCSNVAGNSPPEPLEEKGERGSRLLDAAERALSGDSQRFLRASRQRGGQ